MPQEDKDQIDTVQFTPEQLEMLKVADEAFERGEGFTLAQTREIADKRTRAWLKNHLTA